MFKDERIVRKAATIIAEVSDLVVDKLLRIHDNLEGREEEFTSQLRSEFTLHLMDAIKARFDGLEIKGVKFEVQTFKKREEKFSGADLLGLLEIELEDRTLRKAYLAQAKVGQVINSAAPIPDVKCYSEDLLGQASNMLNLTTSAFVFIYTKAGVFVVPATTVQHQDSNAINTENCYHRRLGSFYEEFFKCFVGDHRLVAPGTTSSDLAKLAKQVNAKNVLLIKAAKQARRLPAVE